MATTSAVQIELNVGRIAVLITSAIGSSLGGFRNVRVDITVVS